MENKYTIFEEKCLELAVKVVELKRILNKEQHEYNMADQIQRSGTAVGALQKESLYAESDIDLIHKLRIALKEASETKYWLDVLYQTEYIDKLKYEEIRNLTEELIRMLTASINTVRSKAIQS
ncbi:MAG: four helix bundle protein [Bacteroidales bacterium]|nr:four helix bundle protein [Candidatus Colicola equi]